ncbi:hypothetical protein PV726_49995 [Streptomyces europaeiscabiei]|nr:hypothetical protein [Streptomyces europaeiscabiei]MDX3698125.1 hypothetical protein [Streptomyces europaeiscabiei]
MTWPWQAIQYRHNAPIPGPTLTEEQAVAAGLILEQTFWDDKQLR